MPASSASLNTRPLGSTRQRHNHQNEEITMTDSTIHQAPGLGALPDPGLITRLRFLRAATRSQLQCRSLLSLHSGLRRS
jgi:hypothetical protein